MPKLKKTKVEPLFTTEDLFRMGREYDEISKQIKELSDRKKSLSEKIKEGAQAYGVKDDKGSYYLEDPDHSICLGKIAKKSYIIDEDKAVATLEEMGLSDVVDVVTTKSVNQEKLNIAVKKGRVSLNVVQSFTTEDVNYSVSVKALEEMPEVEQSNFKIAAKKK